MAPFLDLDFIVKETFERGGAQDQDGVVAENEFVNEVTELGGQT